MNSNYLDVQWIPGSPDQLLTWSTQIKLYQLQDDEVFSVESEIPQPPHYIKCVTAIGGRKDTSDVRVAVGQANGRISLLSFNPQTEGGHVIKEFGPRLGRQCHSLAWNGNRLLAAGYEKNRNDAGILIFDESSSFTTPNSQHHEQIRAHLEMGYGETCTSLTWTHPLSETLVCGVNGKSLRIIDIRQDSSKAVRASTMTRAVFGVSVDPFLDFRIASHVDNQVVIWDIRNFDKPVVTHSQSRKVTKIAWSPTRSGLLCSITDHANSLLLHDIQSWAVMTEDGEPAVTERSISLYKDTLNSDADLVSAFAWHPTAENTLVSVTNSGKLKRVIVSERITPDWSSNHSLSWPRGGILRSFDKDSGLYDKIEDISFIMHERASRGYGPSILENARLVTDDLKRVWTWINDIGKLVENDLNMKSFFSNKTHPGVRTALGLQQNSLGLTGTEGLDRTWIGPNEAMRPRNLYKSEQRERAIKIAGWLSGGSTSITELSKFTSKLEKSGDYSRAAAIAVFSLDLRLALNVLRAGAAFYDGEGGDHHLANSMRMTAVALAGFTEDTTGLWHEMVTSTDAASVSDPYLKIMFSFLLLTKTEDTKEDYRFILESDITVADKIAFACSYLTDKELAEFVDASWRTLLERGDLTALVLTGTSSPETIDLLQRYLDVTGDVQTVSWITSMVVPADLIVGGDPRPRRWIDSFRNLLNAWSLWSSRAEFDIAINYVIKEPLQQIYVSCNFCGRCIGQHVKSMPMNRQIQQQQQQILKSTGRQQRLQACPGCRKPLPRCSVCLINMGTMSGLHLKSPFLSSAADNSSKRAVISPFRNFFSWCQTCRHGGHALHILEWFKDHGECPVSGCSCKCSSLDGGNKLAREDLIEESLT